MKMTMIMVKRLSRYCPRDLCDFLLTEVFKTYVYVCVHTGGGHGANFAAMSTGRFRDSLLVVDFEGETGHGTGPTQEFYSLICRSVPCNSGLLRRVYFYYYLADSIFTFLLVNREVIRCGLRLWRGDPGHSTDDADGIYIHVGLGGLFPSVIKPKSPKAASTPGKQTRTQEETFRFLGRYVCPRILVLLCSGREISPPQSNVFFLVCSSLLHTG